MNFSRREILKGMGAAGLTPLLLQGCGSSSDAGGLPELPTYEYTGPIGPENLFEHGVASGDPLSDGVILWTRITPEPPAEGEDPQPVEVWWEMALDEGFAERTAQGTFMTDASRDYTVKVDVSGLTWGRNYYYRFALQGRWSPTGRTRLTPIADEATKLRFGVCSCANYGFGYFHGFRHMAERADLDAVLHLGDYFYEYGNGTYPGPADQLRMLEPPNETVTLADYRTRYALYRRDPDLQECHRQHPFIVVWDDHESANNSWMGGAENHDPATEGPWADRLAAARQAFFEWIPIRENPDRKLYRAIQYGDLADIFMLDTRIDGREEQYRLQVVPLDDPTVPKEIISAEQEAWLQSRLTTSTAKWKILGNQVVMSIWQFVDPATQEITYANQDQWNGYPEGRGRLMRFFRDNDISNIVVVTGDVHSSWAIDVTVGDESYDPATREGAVAVEFVAPGITSPFEVSEVIAGAFTAQSPHIRYSEITRKGYLVLDVQADKVQSDWYLLDGIAENEGNQSLDASWAVLDGQKHIIEMNGPEAPNDDAPPLAS
ncbi:MAG: alkaline phosphatase D family protein [Polyangiales bacterium]|jgi:alkaline phosphatase D